MDLSQTMSGSLTFEKELVQMIVDKFPEKSKYGLVVFGEEAKVKAAYQPYWSARMFKTMVKNLDAKGTL